MARKTQSAPKAPGKPPARKGGTEPKAGSDRVAPALDTPTDLERPGARDIAEALNRCLADTFAVYLKTKNFHWHVSGRHFRDYHLLLDEQGDELIDATDEMAERVRKIGQTTLRSIGQAARMTGIADNDADFVAPRDMLRELAADNQKLIVGLRAAHELCDERDDIATASLIENWVDAAEKRVWFLFEAGREDDNSR